MAFAELLAWGREMLLAEGMPARCMCSLAH